MIRHIMAKALAIILRFVAIYLKIILVVHLALALFSGGWDKK